MRKIIGLLLLFVSLSVSSYAQTIDIKVNNSDDPVTVDENTNSFSLSVSLDAGSADGRDADWWVVADTPSGFYHLDIAGGVWSWVPGLAVTYQGPLFTIDPTPLPEFPTAGELGEYRFYVGIETKMNGQLDFNDPSGGSVSPSKLEADIGMTWQSTDSNSNDFRAVFDRIDYSKLTTLPPGKRKFFIKDGKDDYHSFSGSEKDVIREVLSNGPFQKHYGECTGVSFEEATSESHLGLRDLIIEKELTPIFLDPATLKVINTDGYYYPPFVQDQNGRRYDHATIQIDPTRYHSSDGFYKLVAHELSHDYGIGSQGGDYPKDGVFSLDGEGGRDFVERDKELFEQTYPKCKKVCPNTAGTSTANQTLSSSASQVCGGPWIGDWILVNFLDDEDEGEWDEDDEDDGIGMIATVTESAWIESDDPNAWEGSPICAVTFSYSVDENYRYSRKAESKNDACGAMPLGWVVTGRLEFTADNKFMIDYFDPAPGNDIAAFKWRRR